MQDALTEIQYHLSENPNDDSGLSLRALILTGLDKADEAVESAQAAIAIDPANSWNHFVYTQVLIALGKYKRAHKAIDQALLLTPDDPDYFTCKASIFHAQENWNKTLEYAEQALSLDPEHFDATNMRALALTRLNRLDEANISLKSALQNDPDDAFTHANQGWLHLQQKETQQALDHFKEALRLDPTMEYARQGIVESLKARNLIYRYMLSYVFWMMGFAPRTRTIIIIGAWLLVNVLNSIEGMLGPFAVITGPITVVYVVFVLMTWTADSFFNLLLRFDSYGKLALNSRQIRQANWLAVCMFFAFVSLVAMIVDFQQSYVYAFLASLFMTIPVTTIFRVRKGIPRYGMIALSLVLASLAGFYVFYGVTIIDPLRASLKPQYVQYEAKFKALQAFQHKPIEELTAEEQNIYNAVVQFNKQGNILMENSKFHDQFWNYFLGGIFISCFLPSFLPGAGNEDDFQVRID